MLENIYLSKPKTVMDNREKIYKTFKVKEIVDLSFTLVW